MQKWQITHLSGGELILITDFCKTKLAENTEDDFDACISHGGRIDVFATERSGSLVHIVYTEGEVSSKVLLKSRTVDTGVCKVRVMTVNSHIHIVYCISRSENLLIHQVYHNGMYCEPRVIDRISDKMVYNVCADENHDIHFVYVDAEGKTIARKYTNSVKNYSLQKVLAHADVRHISVATVGERVYASFTVSENNGASIMVCDVQTEKVLSAVKRVSLRTQTFLVPTEDGFVVKWSENTMCFGIKCSFDMKLSRVTVMGKSGEAVRLRAEDAFSCTDAALCTPSGTVVEQDRICVPQKKITRPVAKGYEVEEMSRKYTELFNKIANAEKFFSEMEKIETKLAKIENLLSKNNQRILYNMEDMEENK